VILGVPRKKFAETRPEILINDLDWVDHCLRQDCRSTHRPSNDENLTQEGAVANALAKGSRITGAQRGTLSSQYAKRYSAGESIRKIAEDAGRSFGFVHGVLKESGVQLRGRGGATRGARKTTSSAGKKATVAPTKKASAKKAPAKSSSTTKTAAKAPSKKTASKAPAKKTSASKSAAKTPAKSTSKSSAGKKSAAKKR
jgi:hypothetical protein